MDSTLLSRIQFGFTMTAHIIYPSISIGVVTFLVIFEGLYLYTRDKIYLSICKFWTKIFALTFGMGVVSGIVMEFQFGTNWGGFSEKVGSILGALFTYEVLTAFFIESGFLGIMLFGWRRVHPYLHYLSTCMVAFGTTLSAFWVLAANSWMQTPSAYRQLADRQLVADGWWDVIFNPSALSRFTHMLLSCYITATFLILGICCYYLFINKHTKTAKICVNFCIIAGCVLLPLQLMMGHHVGVVMHAHQPIKIAAMEGIWETQRGAPTILFAIPNQKTESNDYVLEIPKLASYLNTGDWNAKMVGLKSVPKEDRPNAFIVFWTFRLMVGAGLGMLFVAYLGLILKCFRMHLTSKLYQVLCMLASPLGLLAIETGWMSAEIGRQPWAVYGLLRTHEVASQVSVSQVMTSLICLIVVYGLIFGYFFTKYLLKVIQKGPDRDMDIIEHDALAFNYMSTFKDEAFSEDSNAAKSQKRKPRKD